MKHSSSTGHIPIAKDNIDHHLSPPIPPPPPPPARDISFAVANNIRQSLIQRGPKYKIYFPYEESNLFCSF